MSVPHIKVGAGSNVSLFDLNGSGYPEYCSIVTINSQSFDSIGVQDNDNIYEITQ